MIPRVVSKKEVKENWFPDHPIRDVHEAIQDAVYIFEENSKYRHTIVKQEIVFVIKQLGLPQQFSIDDWYKYVNDPTIETRFPPMSFDL